MSGKRKQQFELAGSETVFNLAGEAANDPWRVERERRLQAEREREGREHAARVQLTLSQCPGFVGCDAPTSEDGAGRVVVEPGRVFEAVAWLKRRFHISENLDLSPDNGLCIDLKMRVRSKSGCARRGRAVPVTFNRPEQFELRLRVETNTES